MSIKCNKCDNKMFDSNAYLKMSKMEEKQKENISLLKCKLEVLKELHGKDSEESIQVNQKLNIERAVLDTISKCKNALY